MAEDRTERPTSRRIRDARRRGQMARSRDVEGAAQLVAVLVVFAWFGGLMVTIVAGEMRAGLQRMGQIAQVGLDQATLLQIVSKSLFAVATVVGPVAIASGAAILAAASLQGGWNVAPEALRVDFGRLNPANGVKRLGVQRAGLDLVKMLLAVAALAWLGYRITAEVIDTAPLLGRLAPYRAAEAGWAWAETLLRQSAIALAIVAGLDYGLQRWRWLKSLKMTKQEVKDDSKMTDGNPEIRARVRRIQQEMFRRRMLSAIPKATVVITNPTHYAVALEYQRQSMGAPRVVAKGKDHLAARIREIARAHGVPTVENVPLAQALYRGCDVGDAIPSDLFGAVAEVLAYLIRLKQIVL